jgi:small subunit ribosomal protein S16
MLAYIRTGSFRASSLSFIKLCKHNLYTMVVRLRLQRFGRTHSPFYRMVAAHSKAPRDGRFLEIVGTYNPMAQQNGVKEIRLKTDRLKYWLSVGAQPSERVAWILGKFGILPPAPRRYNPQSAIPKKDREGAKK